jgi:hypothetical protein
MSSIPLVLFSKASMSFSYIHWELFDVGRDSRSHLIELTADIVSAYVSKNAVPVASLPDLIEGVNSWLLKIRQPTEPEKPAQDAYSPRGLAVGPGRLSHGFAANLEMRESLSRSVWAPRSSLRPTTTADWPFAASA